MLNCLLILLVIWGGNMDYRGMAEEYLAIRVEQIKVPALQLMSKMEKGELFVLNYLRAHARTAYPKDLSRAMAVSTARIAAILNQVAEKGWVVRRDDPEDNRQVIVSLTDEGLARIQRLRDEVVDASAKLLEALGPEDAAELLRIQKKIAGLVLLKM